MRLLTEQQAWFLRVAGDDVTTNCGHTEYPCPCAPDVDHLLSRGLLQDCGIDQRGMQTVEITPLGRLALRCFEALHASFHG